MRLIRPVVVCLALVAVALRAEIPAPELDHGYLKLGFDRLAGYKFVAPSYDAVADAAHPPPTGEEQIPDIVKGWSGKKAVITGFMLPTRLDNGRWSFC